MEVNLHKPLVHKLSFKDRDSSDVSVEIDYPWLPLHCNLCHGWGHVEKECTVVSSVKILKRSQDVLEHREGVVEVAEKVVATGKEAVLDLIQELENTKAISFGGNITGRVSESSGNGKEVMNGEEISKVAVEKQWKNAAHRGRSCSPIGNQMSSEGRMNSASSSNGFAVLQDLREEGEIMEEGECEVVEETKKVSGEVEEDLEEARMGTSRWNSVARWLHLGFTVVGSKGGSRY